MASDCGGVPLDDHEVKHPMSDKCEEMALPMGQSESTVELNPLLQLLGLVSEKRYNFPVSNTVKQIVFSPDGGQLLQALARASRVRVLASLAYLQCAAVDIEVGEAITFLISASDNAILEQVLAKVEGPGTSIAPGLKAALKVSQPIRPLAIGILNRLLSQGCNRKAALDAASPKRHLRVRMNLQFSESYDLHRLTQQVAYLCGSEREIIGLDRIIRSLEQRAPDLLPEGFPLRRLEGLSDLKELLKQRILRYRGEVAVPVVSHPRLEWLCSVPQIRAAGRAFSVCLSSSAVYPLSLILGRSFLAIYTCELPACLPSSYTKYILEIRPIWEDGKLVLAVSEAKGSKNKEMSGRNLLNALEDLNATTGWVWRIDYRMVMDDLSLYEWQLLLE